MEQSFWQTIIDRSSAPEPAEDPVYDPIQALTRTEDFIQNGRRGPDGRLVHEDERVRIAPLLGSIRKIKTAYQILVHPPLNSLLLGFIEDDLARDTRWHERDTVTLSDKEAMILTALTEAAHIPPDPKKRTSLYTEASYSPEKGPLIK